MFRVVALLLSLSAGYPNVTYLHLAAPAQAGEAALVEASQSQLAAGNNGVALEFAERVVARQPFNVEAHHVIQQVLRSRGDNAALVSRYRDLADRYPGTAAAQYLLGNALLLADINDEGRRAARPHFDRALELDPRCGWAASINAILSQLDGDVSEALRLGNVSVEELGSDVTTAAIYADLLKLNGLRAEAIRFMQTATEMNPNEPRYLLELWRIWASGVDDVEAARAQFAAQFTANRGRFLDTPGHAAALARFLSSPAMADRDAARATWLELADRFPESIEAKNALLRAARMTTDFDDKIDLYNRIFDEYPESSIRYTIYAELLSGLIWNEEYDRAVRTARGLTTEPDPGRGDDHEPGFHEGSTSWGFTLQGIGYAGWFAAEQAAAGVKDSYISLGGLRPRADRPISPGALVAARALETSGCNDPRTLQYVGEQLLNNSYYRTLGIRLIERAVRAAEGGDPLTELAYGTEELAKARKALDRVLDAMPLHYAEAGMLPEAERAIEELLRSLSADDREATHARVNYVAGYVFERVGRYRAAARHYLISQWYPISMQWYPASMSGDFGERLNTLYRRIADSDVRRFEPGSGPRFPLAAAGIRAIDETPLDGDSLDGELLLVLLWSTWSESSIAQLEMLGEMAESLRESGVSSLAVVMQKAPEPWFRAAGGDTVMSRVPPHLSAGIPLARAQLETIDRLELVGVPTTFLIDATGRMLARQLSFDLLPGTWAMQWRDVIDTELGRLRQARRPR